MTEIFHERSDNNLSTIEVDATFEEIVATNFRQGVAEIDAADIPADVLAALEAEYRPEKRGPRNDAGYGRRWHT